MLHLKESYTPHPRKWWHIPLLLLLIVGTILIARQYKSKSSTVTKQTWAADETQTTEGAIFGTFYHITYRHTSNLSEGIDSTLRVVDNSLSPFNQNSVITAINSNKTTQADSNLVKVIALAQNISEVTDGAFDITVAPLVNAWGFGFKKASSVSPQLIDSLLQYVGYKKIQLEKGGIIRKEHPKIQLDCSAIAKGYGVDAVGEYLETKGVYNYMVEIGGEIRIRGKNPQGASWRIGVNKPIEDSLVTEMPLQDVLQVDNIAMATSGNYRNFYIRNGKKYAHTINPHTGHPVQHSLLSATVLASDCATADAYATAFMVLGIDSAKKILHKHPELKAYFIYSSPQDSMLVWHSPDLTISEK